MLISLVSIPGNAIIITTETQLNSLLLYHSYVLVPLAIATLSGVPAIEILFLVSFGLTTLLGNSNSSPGSNGFGYHWDSVHELERNSCKLRRSLPKFGRS
jgi:hypothetical protein